jgi:AraC-like DNA-binding protein
MLLRHDAFNRLCQARDLLAEVREQQLSIKDIACEVHISPFHFIRQFEGLFGVTPHQFRIQARLDHAKRLLAAGNLSVTDVCVEVGFASPGTFSDLFARRVGTPPSAYQRRARVLVQVPGGAARFVPWMPQPDGLFTDVRFSQFSRSILRRAPLEFGHANQTNQNHSGRSGQCAEILRGRARLPQEARNSSWRVQVAHCHFSGGTGIPASQAKN